MAKPNRDLAFTERLRDLLHLRDDADLEFVFDPDVRAQLDGSSPGWLFRAITPFEKRQIVLSYCNGAEVGFLSRRFTRAKSSIVRVLKEVEIYKAEPERLAEFIKEREIERWHDEWLLRWRRRKVCAAIAKD
jgi:hypothetical protein